MLKYTQQNSSQTLKEGLQEYYDSNPQEVKDFAKKIPFLVDHDITHVIFGLGTSIEEESLLDTWTIRGTDISWKQILIILEHYIQQLHHQILTFVVR